ncbi:transmembrane protein NRF-6 [Trypanosoma rangeli]|uniref:Transmembrane protein NRF-6 n=1 Tax=Trypanosoma rangeli TaxID=5698 RepID=A0A422NG75_TRYRA|nr:transmembrane protein NRF-6 [Trypanosoma rangeli]RNF04447.1 transmembrane protein NRF-6 [Trypanosoma rangeli]|eukprot:RNF04447.1 transmembrane protein NRF-6 [Trypanosoma rangeli]
MVGSALLRHVELPRQRLVFLSPSIVSHHALPLGIVYQYSPLMFIIIIGAVFHYLYEALRQRAEMLSMFGLIFFKMMYRIHEGAVTVDRVSYCLLERLRMRRKGIFIVWCVLAITLFCVLSAWVIHRDDGRGF